MTASIEHVAEQRDLFAVFAADRLLGAADEHVGLDADLAQLADGVLRRLRFEFAGRLEIRHEREVDVEAVLLADVERELADRFEERQALDVADVPPISVITTSTSPSPRV
jgi:hypothetical protein